VFTCKPRKAGCSNRWRSPKRIRWPPPPAFHHGSAVLMGFSSAEKCCPGKEPAQSLLIWVYHPVIDFVIRWRWAMILPPG